MRKLLLLSVVATLAACDESSSTAPAAKPAAPTLSVSDPTAPVSQAKPAATGSGFSKVTVVSGNVASISAYGGAVGAYAYCPTGTTPISGGHVFTYEGNWTVVPSVTQSVPIINGWFIRALLPTTGSAGASFKAYAVCAS